MYDVDAGQRPFPGTDVLDPISAFAKPWRVAIVALAAGVAIDTLALHHPPGVGLALGLALSVLIAGSSSWLLDAPRPVALGAVRGAALVFAGFVGVRTSPVLITLNVSVVIFSVAVLAQLRHAGGPMAWSITNYARHPFTSLGDCMAGAGRFVGADLRAGFSEAHSQRARSISLGLLIAAPLVLVFGGLFAAADVVFSDYVQRLTSGVVLGSLFWRATSSLAIALLVAGLWRSLRAPTSRPEPRPIPEQSLVDGTTGSTVLALLVGLFSLFLVTQVIGHDPELVRNADFSENARRGFFQLVTVAFLVLNVLLYFDFLTRRADGRRWPAFDRLAVALIALTGVVMVSALERMRLYVRELGFTELRFYTTVFMFWLGFVLLWFILTVLRNRRPQFAAGLLVSGLLVVLGLNLANPDALIVNLNWDRHLDGHAFSDRYNSELSTDSLLALVAIREQQPGRWCFIDERLRREQLALEDYRATHGVLADSWAAWRARTVLQGLDLDYVDSVDCAANLRAAPPPVSPPPAVALPL